jgi:hypothetical protein
MSTFTDRMNKIHEYNFNKSYTQPNQSNIQCNQSYINYYNASNSSSTTSSSTKGYAVIHANNIPLWFSQKHCQSG